MQGAEFRQIFEAWRDALRAVIRPDEPWALVGVKRRGALLARRLLEEFRAEFPDLALGEIDITLYRDDFHLNHSQPHVLGTEIDFSVDGRRILLIDDVLFSGRTIRAAIDQILDYGRPHQVLLAVLVDRGHHELPIAADFAGVVLRTQREDRIQVRLEELDEEGDRLLLVRGGLPKV